LRTKLDKNFKDGLILIFT